MRTGVPPPKGPATETTTTSSLTVGPESAPPAWTVGPEPAPPARAVAVDETFTGPEEDGGRAVGLRESVCEVAHVWRMCVDVCPCTHTGQLGGCTREWSVVRVLCGCAWVVGASVGGREGPDWGTPPFEEVWSGKTPGSRWGQGKGPEHGCRGRHGGQRDLQQASGV